MQTWLLPAVIVLAIPAAASASEDAGGSGLAQRMAGLMVQLGVLLFATKAGNLCFRRLRLPGMLGELAAGAVVGPCLLGSLPLPGYPAGLFPATTGLGFGPELFGVCSLASVVLLFMVGLETDLRMVLRNSVAGTMVGVGGVVASFVLGDLCGVLFGSAVFGRELGFMDPPCLFLGVISTATSVGITARVLTDRRRLDTPEGVTTLAAAVIDDVLSIGVLTVVLALTSATVSTGISWARVGSTGAKAFGIWLSVTLLGLLLAHRIGELLKRFRGRTSISIMALGLVLIVAGLFESAGLAMMIGAYIIGLTQSPTYLAHVIREQQEPLSVPGPPVLRGHRCARGLARAGESLGHRAGAGLHRAGAAGESGRLRPAVAAVRLQRPWRTTHRRGDGPPRRSGPDCGECRLDRGSLLA